MIIRIESELEFIMNQDRNLHLLIHINHYLANYIYNYFSVMKERGSRNEHMK